MDSNKDLKNILNIHNGDSNDDLAKKGSKYGEDEVCLDDFEILAVLGRGGFGKVMAVQHKRTKEIFAMKTLKKHELQRRKQVERTQTERNILAQIRNPFIVRLYFAFQSDTKLYMVMDFVQGGEFVCV